MFDDLILEKHMGQIIPAHPSMAIASYIKDYRIKKNIIQVRMFLSEKWSNAISLNKSNIDIVKYIKSPNKKQTILFIANGLIDRGYTPHKSLWLAISDKVETNRNINRMIRI